MRITIQVTCESPQDAMEAMARLTKPAQRQEFVGSTLEELDRYLSVGKKKPEPVLEREVETVTRSDIVKADSVQIGTPPSRPNVSPGEPAIGKIGQNAKDEIIMKLAEGRQPDLKKYGEHMKLLWKRGEIKFDGQEYYL
jgi:hypothetical protein